MTQEDLNRLWEMTVKENGYEDLDAYEEERGDDGWGPVEESFAQKCQELGGAVMGDLLEGLNNDDVDTLNKFLSDLGFDLFMDPRQEAPDDSCDSWAAFPKLKK